MIPAQSPAIKPLANSPAMISKPKTVRILVRSLTNTYPRVYPLHAFLRICELVCNLRRPSIRSASLRWRHKRVAHPLIPMCQHMLDVRQIDSYLSYWFLRDNGLVFTARAAEYFWALRIGKWRFRRSFHVTMRLLVSTLSCALPCNKGGACSRLS